MHRSKLGTASLCVFGLVVLSGVGIAIVAALPPFGGGGEWRGLGNVFFSLLFGGTAFVLSLIGFCLALAGLIRRRQMEATAVAGAMLNGFVALTVVIWLIVTNY